MPRHSTPTRRGQASGRNPANFAAPTGRRARDWLSDAPWPKWRNGRRRGFKIPRWRQRVGSNPTLGTTVFKGMHAAFGGVVTDLATDSHVIFWTAAFAQCETLPCGSLLSDIWQRFRGSDPAQPEFPHRSSRPRQLRRMRASGGRGDCNDLRRHRALSLERQASCATPGMTSLHHRRIVEYSPTSQAHDAGLAQVARPPSSNVQGSRYRTSRHPFHLQQ